MSPAVRLDSEQIEKQTTGRGSRKRNDHSYSDKGQFGEEEPQTDLLTESQGWARGGLFPRCQDPQTHHHTHIGYLEGDGCCWTEWLAPPWTGKKISNEFILYSCIEANKDLISVFKTKEKVTHSCWLALHTVDDQGTYIFFPNILNSELYWNSETEVGKGGT